MPSPLLFTCGVSFSVGSYSRHFPSFSNARAWPYANAQRPKAGYMGTGKTCTQVHHPPRQPYGKNPAEPLVQAWNELAFRSHKRRLIQSGIRRATPFLPRTPNIGRNKNVPKREHIAAAELQEKAARSHRLAADQYDSAEAYSHSVRAYAASKHAHEKSTHHKKHA